MGSDNHLFSNIFSNEAIDKIYSQNSSAFSEHEMLGLPPSGDLLGKYSNLEYKHFCIAGPVDLGEAMCFIFLFTYVCGHFEHGYK